MKQMPASDIIKDEKEYVMITSKLDSNAQTIIPDLVRAALSLEENDVIEFLIKGEEVIMTNTKLTTNESASGVFREWESEADQIAYANL